MSDKRRVLTGITTSGTPHLGNYVGAIRPAVASSRDADVESFFFLADYHALIKCDDPARVQQSTLEIAATWLASGLDPDRVFFYRQSDIPEIPELTWLLTCVTGKGLLNRAHAYKAAVDQNSEAAEDPDAGITAGLYMYPVLMAADILMFKADEVPVGRDQVQHLEIARDIAQRFNHVYAEPLAAAGDALVLPEVRIDENVATLPGTDGRKMSKSYNNTIPLWLPADELRKAIFGIVTDSSHPDAPKDPDASNLFALYRAFATAQETESMRAAYAAGIRWGEAKERLFERIDAELGDARARYEALMAHPDRIEALLEAGAEKARARSRPFMKKLRWAVGVRPLDAGTGTPAAAAAKPAAKSALPQIKRFREQDGRFRFKLADADGAVLLTSRAFADPREIGELVDLLVDAGAGVERETPALDRVIDAAATDWDASAARIRSALALLKQDKLDRESAKAG